EVGLARARQRAGDGAAVVGRGEGAPRGFAEGPGELGAEGGRCKTSQAVVVEEPGPADVTVGHGRVRTGDEAPDPVAEIPARGRLGHEVRGDRREAAAECPREPRVELRHADAEIPRVAAEGFVAADPGERD